MPTMPHVPPLTPVVIPPHPEPSRFLWRPQRLTRVSPLPTGRGIPRLLRCLLMVMHAPCRLARRSRHCAHGGFPMQTSRRHDLNLRKMSDPAGWHLKRSHAARGLASLAVVMLLTALLPSSARAGTELGQLCWKLDPFVDTLRLAITQATGDAPIFEIHGRWRATAAAGQQAAGGAGPATYQL